MTKAKVILRSMFLFCLTATHAAAKHAPEPTKNQTAVPSQTQSARAWVDGELDRLELLVAQFHRLHETPPPDRPTNQCDVYSLAEFAGSGQEVRNAIEMLEKHPKTEVQKIRLQSITGKLKQDPLWLKYREEASLKAQQAEMMKNAPSAQEIHDFLNAPWNPPAPDAPSKTRQQQGSAPRKNPIKPK